MPNRLQHYIAANYLSNRYGYIDLLVGLIPNNYKNRLVILVVIVLVVLRIFIKDEADRTDREEQ